MSLRKLILSVAALAVFAAAPALWAQDTGTRDRKAGARDRGTDARKTDDRGTAAANTYRGRIARVDAAARDVVVTTVAAPVGTGTRPLPGTRPRPGAVPPAAPPPPPAAAPPPATTPVAARPTERPRAARRRGETPVTPPPVARPPAGTPVPAAGARTMRFHLTKDATITVDGRKADLKDLRMGMFVRVHALNQTGVKTVPPRRAAAAPPPAAAPTGRPAPAADRAPATVVKMTADRIEAFTKETKAGTGRGTAVPPVRR